MYHIPAEKEREDVSVLSPVVRLFQKTVDDLLLRLFLRQAQGHQLDELLPGVLPMAASWTRLASTQLAVTSGMAATTP